MLRTSAARVLAAAPRTAYRPLSSSAPTFIRIKKPEGAASAPASPSPAEKPASVPEDIKPSKPFEPIVSKPTPTTAPSGSSETTDAAQTSSGPIPSEPPAPDASKSAATDAAAEEPTGNVDFSALPSLDIDPEAQERIEQPKEEAKGKKRGDRKGPEYVSSADLKRRMWLRLGLASVVAGAIGVGFYAGEKDGKESERSAWERFKGNFTEVGDYFSKPAFSQLLPDPLPAPHQRPYTLLVDLDDLLVHSNWDRQHGWRTAKRPGVDYFLAYLSQFYEIVLFTAQPVYTALSVAEKLDPFTLYLPYKLFREATRSVNGKVVKDLSYLNRDLSKVIMLDINADHAALQPENAIIMKPWDGKPRDQGLIEMIPFLESIGIYAPADVRPILQRYAGKDIPREYAKIEAENKARAVAEWERTHPTSASGSGSNFLSGLFGGGGGSARPSQPMTYLEIKRAQAQRAYEEEQKYYKEHAEEFTKMIEEDKQRQQEEMNKSMMAWFTGKSDPKDGQPPAGQAAPAQSAPAQSAAK